MSTHHDLLPKDDDQHLHFAPWERQAGRLLTPLEEFVRDETASGVVLMACALVALILANSNWAEAYAHLLHMPIGIAVGAWRLEYSLHHWINDGLMTLFFFVAGLEIKREVLVGELSDLKRALLPIMAAVGGMLVPALIYAAINTGEPTARGWGIPMATDIAFAVGVLVLLGDRIPKSLIAFLVAAAIADDLGGMIVIALFYTDTLNSVALMAAGGLVALLAIFNRSGVRSPLPYFLVGTLLWLALLKSGVHATLAGVLTALTIPAYAKYNPQLFQDRVADLLNIFRRTHQPDESIMRNGRQVAALQGLETALHRVQTPLQRLEHGLHLPVAFLVMPIFALANAGIPLSLDSVGQALTDPVALGVLAGLTVGKFVGIAGFTWGAVKLGLGTLPSGVTLHHVVGLGLVGGIGFTMSLFIAELGLSEPQHLLHAKVGILVGSLLAGVSGYLWLRLACNKK